MSDLGGAQMSTLLESLPGIASVLRSPVADAMVNVIRAAARLGEFAPEDAEELVQYATRRGLLGMEEGDRLLAEVQEAGERRAAKASHRAKAKKAKAKAAGKRATGKKAPKKKR